MFMVLSSRLSHFESSSSSSDVRRPAPTDLGCESACRLLYGLHVHHRHFSITQLESWYSFYRPTEGGRLSQDYSTSTLYVYSAVCSMYFVYDIIINKFVNSVKQTTWRSISSTLLAGCRISFPRRVCLYKQFDIYFDVNRVCLRRNKYRTAWQVTLPFQYIGLGLNIAFLFHSVSRRTDFVFVARRKLTVFTV